MTWVCSGHGYEQSIFQPTCNHSIETAKCSFEHKHVFGFEENTRDKDWCCVNCYLSGGRMQKNFAAAKYCLECKLPYNPHTKEGAFYLVWCQTCTKKDLEDDTRSGLYTIPITECLCPGGCGKAVDWPTTLPQGTATLPNFLPVISIQSDWFDIYGRWVCARRGGCARIVRGNRASCSTPHCPGRREGAEGILVCRPNN